MANHPTLLIWRTNEVGATDHAAILTANYYISFWPNRYVECRFGDVRAGTSFEEPGRLVFSPEFDINIQRGNQPHRRIVLTNVTNGDIEVLYKGFLKHNRIDIIEEPDVTLTKANEVLYNRNAHNGHEQQMIDENYEYFYDNLSKYTPYTKYTIGGHILLHKPFKNILRYIDRLYRFYVFPQSSITFAYNLIESADNYKDLPFYTCYLDCSISFRFYCHIFTSNELEDIADRFYRREKAPIRMWYRSILDSIPLANKALTKITGYRFDQ